MRNGAGWSETLTTVTLPLYRLRSWRQCTTHLLVSTATAGGSIASCFNDLWQLDLARGAWSKPELHGPSPTPRAGHSGSLVGDYWYILGGGNNVKGETHV